jgi:hypothetical protein
MQEWISGGGANQQLLTRRVNRNWWEPVVPVQTGSGSDRFPTGSNSEFEFEFKNEKISQNSQKYFKVCRI